MGHSLTQGVAIGLKYAGPTGLKCVDRKAEECFKETPAIFKYPALLPLKGLGGRMWLLRLIKNIVN